MVTGVSCFEPATKNESACLMEQTEILVTVHTGTKTVVALVGLTDKPSREGTYSLNFAAAGLAKVLG